MPRPKPQRVLLGGKTPMSLVGDVLYYGKHALSIQDCIIVGLTNAQAIEYMQAGFKIRCSAKGSLFLGMTNPEHVLYLTIDIPRNFDTDKIRLWRLETNLFDRSMKATIEFTAQYFCFDPSGKDGYKLSLTDIYMPDDDEEDDRSGFEVLKDLEAVEDFESARTGIYYHTQRDYDQRNNRQRTVWALGDEVTLNGETYEVGRVMEIGDTWSIRLDRKFNPSAFIRVLK